ncbi:hypothetical protein [Trichormus variabilis]|uniref:hypothetical protein n=1 Tax=Anabaena variabilis TaxID=264691 RepID=UPI000F8EA42B|nr:hypothetical protein [Trichormus variabilis]MBD2629281.1 hypothetical protein [Trichormus variabilis FACHB-164]
MNMRFISGCKDFIPLLASIPNLQQFLGKLTTFLDHTHRCGVVSRRVSTKEERNPDIQSVF